MLESRESDKGDSLWILRNFQEYLFWRTSVNAYLPKMKQWKNVLTIIFTENHRWWCLLKYSSRIEGLEHGYLQFCLKGTQSQILSCKTCEVLQSFSFTQYYLLLGNCFWFPAIFLTYHFLYQQYINSVTISCLGTPVIATCQWSALLVLKMFKGNKKKQVESNILGLRLTQRRKWYVLEAVAQRSSAKKSAVKYLELQLLSAISCCTTPQTFQSIVRYRSCSIITWRIGVGWVSAFFVMLRDGKLGGEWYFMNGCHVIVKKIKKPFFCTIVKRSAFH